MFVDLHKEISNIKYKFPEDRILKLVKLVENFRGPNIIAIGGFPLVDEGREYTWAGNTIYPLLIKDMITKGLGLSGMLTYMNMSNMSLNALGELCTKKNHNWAYNWMSLSVLLCGYDKEIEMAFTRDTKFFMSWPVRDDSGKVFAANGSLKSWIKFIANKDNKDFSEDVRKAMYDVHNILKEILP